MTKKIAPESYWKVVFRQFTKNRIGFSAFVILLIFFIIGLYAPFFASSKPLVVQYEGKWYFPLMRYLFFTGFYTKPVDIFYNLLMFTLPVAILGITFLKRGLRAFLITLVAIHLALFLFLISGIVKDPATDIQLLQSRKKFAEKTTPFREDTLLSPFKSYPTWASELTFMNEYEKLNLVLTYIQRKKQQERLESYNELYKKAQGRNMPTLWQLDQKNAGEDKQKAERFLAQNKTSYEEAVSQFPKLLAAYKPYSNDLMIEKRKWEQAVFFEQKAFTTAEKIKAQENLEASLKNLEEAQKKATPLQKELEKVRSTIQTYRDVEGRLQFFEDRRVWLDQQVHQMDILIPPLIRPFHWEDDAGGQQEINKYVPWWELSRVNRKDLVAALIFGIRISLVVGFTAVALSLLIGIPFGMIAGYFLGKTDMIVSRLIEIWEAMPTFFMLLLIVAITQSKSIFLVVAVLGIFGWTGLARFMRGEALKQRNLPYVQACYSQGFGHSKIMYSQVLPNAIPPILTLIPFSMMAAISSEAGISFLGLGEEGSTSWGVLMAEGRSVFPGESYLLWPPAILLTILLISIAIVGDALRDAIDPKMR